ncbi:hypothetical protein, partial [Cellulomonas shaoxiangyii]
MLHGAGRRRAGAGALAVLGAAAAAPWTSSSHTLPVAGLALLLGLVPLACLAAGTAGTPPTRRTRAAAVSAVALGTLLAALGVLAASPLGFLDLRLALGHWRLTVTAVTAFAPVGVALLGVAAVLVGTGVLRRRRLPVALAAGTSAAVALGAVVGVGAQTVATAVALARYRTAAPVAALLADGYVPVGAVALVAAVVATWAAVRAPRRLAHWVPAPVAALDPAARR